jgi:Undecaprenyl-phosphate galactose phosphotransferase WbaP
MRSRCVPLPFAFSMLMSRLAMASWETIYHRTTLMLPNNSYQSLRYFLKNLLDRGVALTAIVLLWPIAAVVAVVVALDGGPVFFKHIRIGQNGQRFGCLKFRSMAVNSDEILADTLASDAAAAAEWALTQKLRNDPRVTRIGGILRKTSLDELPQLLNVLTGNMSLVGPRPIVDAEMVRYGEGVEFYYRCKPGITGLWQISGRSNTTYDQRVALDTWYVKNWSLRRDVAILVQTVPVLLRRQGAV